MTFESAREWEPCRHCGTTLTAVPAKDDGGVLRIKCFCGIIVEAVNFEQLYNKWHYGRSIQAYAGKSLC
jgi:hypothetical protein